MSPRAMSISSSRVRVTASPAAARASGPSKVTISLTREARDEPMTWTGSPGATAPDAIGARKPAEFAGSGD